MSMSPRTNVIETVRQHRDNLLSRGVGAFTTGAIAGIASAAKEVLIGKLPLFPSPEQTPIVLENAGIVAIEGTLFSIAGQVLVNNGLLKRHPLATAVGTIGGFVTAGISTSLGMPTQFVIPTFVTAATITGIAAEKLIDPTKGFGRTIVNIAGKIIPGPASSVAVLKKPAIRIAEKPVVVEKPRRKTKNEIEFERTQTTIIGITEQGADVFLSELDKINNLQVQVQQFERAPRTLPRGTTKEGLEDQMVDRFFNVWSWYMKNRPFTSGSEIDDTDIEYVESNKADILQNAVATWGKSQMNYDMHDLLQVLIESTNPVNDFVDLADFIQLDTKLPYKDKAQVGLIVIRYTDSLAARITSERERFERSNKTSKDEQRYFTVVKKAVKDWEVSLDKFFEQSPPNLHA